MKTKTHSLIDDILGTYVEVIGYALVLLGFGALLGLVLLAFAPFMLLFLPMRVIEWLRRA